MAELIQIQCSPLLNQDFIYLLYVKVPSEKLLEKRGYKLSALVPFTRPILCRGRAITLKERLVEETSLSCFSSVSCRSRFMPLIRVNGTVLACCFANKDIIEKDSYLFLGNANKESLFEILKRGERNYFVKALIERGPKKIYNEKQKKLKTIFPPKKYQTICDFCTELSNKKNWRDV